MPAGRMFLAKTTMRRRRYKRRGSAFKKAVTAIAKRTVNRLAEHRYLALPISNAFGSNGNLTPLYANVTKGDNQTDRDGDQIRSTGVTIRGYVGQDSAVITSNQDFNAVRMIVCSGKRPLTTGDMPGYKDAIDKEKLNVLVDRYINFSTTKRQVWFKQYVKYDRLIPYEGTAVNKNELYVWLIPFGGTGLTTTTGNYVNLNFHMGFRDI